MVLVFPIFQYENLIKHLNFYFPLLIFIVYMHITDTNPFQQPLDESNCKPNVI